MSFSLVLKQLREEKNLSQKDIADFLGVTRQAIAAYELAKREPDYEVLRKLADYFGVSIDYLLGRTGCRDENALTIGKNIELLRGKMTFKELSEDIFRKTGAVVFPEMLQLYAKGERAPFTGTIKILARYAGVNESFFYNHNNHVSFKREKELFDREMEQHRQADSSIEEDSGPDERLGFIGDDIMDWLTQENNLPYLRLAKCIQESGMDISALEPLVENFRRRNS